MARDRIEGGFTLAMVAGIIGIIGSLGICITSIPLGIASAALCGVAIGLLAAAWNLAIAVVDLADASILRLSKDR